MIGPHKRNGTEPPAGRRPPRRGRGFMLLEITAAVFVLGAALVLTVELLGWLGAAQKADVRRRWAGLEAENTLERLTTLPIAELTREKVDGMGLSQRAEKALPGGRLDVTLAEQSGPPSSMRLTVTVRWNDRTGRPAAPVRLTGWVYPTEGDR